MRMGNEYAVERTMGRTESGKCQSKRIRHTETH